MSRTDQTATAWSIRRDWTRDDTRAALALGAVWAAVGAIVGLGGDFPLNDDFSYTLSAEWLAEEGIFRRTPFTYVPAVPHLLLGAAAIKVFGFSHEILRTISFVITGCSVLAAYCLARQLGSGVRLAAFAALALMFNPVALNLGFTFMTDPTFLLFIMVGSVIGVEALRSGSWIAYAGVAICSVLATLTRQPGLALPIGFAFAAVWSAPQRPASWIKGGIAIGLSTFALASFEERMVSPGESLATVDTLVWLVSSESIVYRVAFNLISTGSFIGFFLFPVALVSWRRDQLPPMPLLWLAGSALVAVVGFWYFDLKSPSLPNLIHPQGVGPLGVLEQQARPRVAEALFQLSSRAGGAFGLVIAAGFVLRQWRRLLTDPALLFALAVVGVFLVPHLTRTPLFDRYALVLLPALSAAIVGVAARDSVARWRQGLGAAIVCAMGLYSVAGTHDMLARHRGINELIDEAVALGHVRTQVRGGFALRGYHHHHDRDWFREDGRTYLPEHWVTDATAAVHYGIAEDAIASVEVDRWFPPGTDTFSLTLVHQDLPKYERD